MKRIKVTNQKEWNALPKSFDEFTVIEIHSSELIGIRSNPSNSSAVLRNNSKAVLWENSRAELRNNSRAELWENSKAELWDNSRAELWENSRAELWENSKAELWDNSRAELWENSKAELWDNSSAVLRNSSRAELWDNSSAVLWNRSFCHVYSGDSNIALEDYATAHLVDCAPEVNKSKHATVIQSPSIIDRDFDYMLSRGYIHADGITKKLKSKKQVGEVTVYTVEEFLDQSESYVAQKGDIFAHGETVKEAIEDLRYKFSDRDTSKFESWELDDEKTLDEFLEAYHAITGACSKGMKEFVQAKQPPERCTVRQAIELTKCSYQSDVFKEYFLGGE